MRKYIVVSPTADPAVFDRYQDFDFVGVDGGILIARQAGIRLKLAISDFENVPLNYVLSFMDKDSVMRYSHESDQSRYEKIISYLLKKGGEEIVILATPGGKLDHLYNLLLILKNDRAKIYIQDKNNFISYYGVGSHVIMRQDYEKIAVIGFPSATVSMEHVVTPIKKTPIRLGFDRALSNRILERLAVLRVEEGGVIAVLEK